MNQRVTQFNFLEKAKTEKGVRKGRGWMARSDKLKLWTWLTTQNSPSKSNLPTSTVRSDKEQDTVHPYTTMTPCYVMATHAFKQTLSSRTGLHENQEIWMGKECWVGSEEVGVMWGWWQNEDHTKQAERGSKTTQNKTLRMCCTASYIQQL